MLIIVDWNWNLEVTNISAILKYRSIVFIGTKTSDEGVCRCMHARFASEEKKIGRLRIWRWIEIMKERHSLDKSEIRFFGPSFECGKILKDCIKRIDHQNPVSFLSMNDIISLSPSHQNRYLPICSLLVSIVVKNLFKSRRITLSFVIFESFRMSIE